MRGRQFTRHMPKLLTIDSPEAVTELNGLEIHVPRVNAVPLPEDHYYLDDLIGIETFDEDGRELGTVTEVLRTGSNDVYVIRSANVEVLVPGTSEAVKELDLPRRRMVIASWILEPESEGS